MTELPNTRVIELSPGQWVVQFEGGIGNQWTTFSDVFATRAEAEIFERSQLDSADYG